MEIESSSDDELASTLSAFAGPRRLETEQLIFRDFAHFKFSPHDHDVNKLLALATFRFCQELELVVSVPHSLHIAVVIRLLVSYGFDAEDIEQLMALSLARLQLLNSLMNKMRHEERGMCVIVQMYLTHCFLYDEHIPLREWHAQFFEEYCDLATLEDAVVKLWRQNDYRILVAEPQLDACVTLLRQPVN